MPFRGPFPNSLRPPSRPGLGVGVCVSPAPPACHAGDTPKLAPRPALETAAVAGQRQPVNTDGIAVKTGSCGRVDPASPPRCAGDPHPDLLAGATPCTPNGRAA